MSRNPSLELLRNPRPYPHGENGTTPPRTKQPNRALDELRKPQPYPSASQPAQRPPAQSQPGRYAPPPNASQPRPPQNNQLGNLRNPQPYPSASQPQAMPKNKTPQSTGRPPAPQSHGPPQSTGRPPAPQSHGPPQSTGRPPAPQSRGTPVTQPPSASQPRSSPAPAQGKPTGAPQKKKPRVAVSSGTPKPYQHPRQTAQHVTPPVRTLPPSASQPQPQRYQPRPTQTQTPTPQTYTPRSTTPRTTSPVTPRATTPQATTPRATTPRATTPRATTPIQQPPVLTTEPPTPQHTNNEPTQYDYEYEPSYATSIPSPTFSQPYPTYRNPPPSDTNLRLTPTSGYDESDVADNDRDSRRSYGRDIPSPESDIESGPASERTPSPLPEKKIPSFDEEIDNQPQRAKSTSRLADTHGSSDRRKIYAIIFIVILAFALALGLGLSNRGVDYSRSFAITLGSECSMVCDNPSENGYTRQSVLMIALDGFRPEYMNESWRETIPNIHRLAECGSVATKMEPSYPSTTYPNLYTLVTGLFPTVHGVIADYLERDGLPGNFDPRNSPQSATLQNPGWYNGKPIWQLAKEQGVITGSHSWIGNAVQEQSINGFRVDPNPNYYVQHNPDINFHARIQSALNWFTQPTNKAKFVNVYMEEPGRTIMQNGVSSDKVKMALEEVDDAIGLFMENLVRDDVTGCFDIIIVSTNGHLDVNCDNTTYFNSILPNTLFYDTSTNGMNSMAFFTPTAESPTDSDTAEELVSKLGCQTRPFESYTLDTVPSKYHFYNKNRHEAAMVIMDDWQTFASTQQNFDTETCTGARGGYNPANPEMKGVLIGFGPSFKKNFTRMEGFSNVEVYNLLSELVDIQSENNNGTHGTLNDLLRSPDVLLTDVEEQTYFGRESSMCMFPSDVDKSSKRNQASTGCQCNNEALSNLGQNINIDEKDNLLDITPGVAESLVIEQHAPFGAPKLLDIDGAAGGHHCQLVQNNYMTVFENKLSIPLYVAYKVTNQRSTNELESCYRYDLRLTPEVSPKCNSYNSANEDSLPDGMEMAFLLQQSLAGDLNDQFNILITSNMVPMWNQFVTDVWTPIAGQLRNMASGGQDIRVVAGPAFDTNRDGVRDSYQDIAFWSNAWVGKTPVPTHYFLVITRCADTTTSVSLCEMDKIETVAYIFPHTKGILTCDQSIQEYMMTYQASVVDVERITGTFFFSRKADDNNEKNLKLLLDLKMSREPF